MIFPNKRNTFHRVSIETFHRVSIEIDPGVLTDRDILYFYCFTANVVTDFNEISLIGGSDMIQGTIDWTVAVFRFHI